MRRLLLTIGVVILVGVGVAGVSDAFSSGHSPGAHAASPPRKKKKRVVGSPATHRVEIQNFAFSPARLVVSRGTRIVWTNRDSAPHTVTTYAPGFSSQVLNKGGTYAVVMKRTGTFTYYCTIHPFMQGTVVVRR